MSDKQIIGYRTSDSSLPVRYANPDMKKNKAYYFPKMIDFEKAASFVNEKSVEFDRLCRDVVPDVLEARFTLEDHTAVPYKGVAPSYKIRCMMTSNRSLTDEELDDLKATGATFLKRLAKEFNDQTFTETEYGHVKMPKSMEHGFWFTKDDRVIDRMKESYYVQDFADAVAGISVDDNSLIK